MSAPTPKRPVVRASMDNEMSGYDGVGGDPARRVELAHTTAAAVLRAARDGDVVAPVDLVERIGGIEVLAELWRDAEAGSLPATLLTLHLLRTWCRQSGTEAARLYGIGVVREEVASVVAGVVLPPGPRDVADVADAVLTSTYAGDLAVALERAAAFSTVVASGRRSVAHDRAGDDPTEATRQLRLAVGNDRCARDLTQAARAWRAGALI